MKVMTSRVVWIEGSPTEAGWYLSAWKYADCERFATAMLWFNPQSIDKWYSGGGFMQAKASPWIWPTPCAAFAHVPCYSRPT